MNIQEDIIVKGNKYNKEYLHKNNFEFMNDSEIFFFYRKGNTAYVFEKPREKQDDEYLLVAVWKD
ncbi:MAG: hypothetical protein ACOYO1_06375 [Bacteroidales bacterium]